MHLKHWGHGAAWVGKLLGLEGMCRGEVDKRRTIFPLKVQKHWSQKHKANRESINQDNDSTSLYVCLLLCNVIQFMYETLYFAFKVQICNAQNPVSSTNPLVGGGHSSGSTGHCSNGVTIWFHPTRNNAPMISGNGHMIKPTWGINKYHQRLWGMQRNRRAAEEILGK